MINLFKKIGALLKGELHSSSPSPFFPLPSPLAGGASMRPQAHDIEAVIRQALEATDYEYQTLADFKHVAGKIELSSRDDNLSFMRHRP